MSFFLFYFNQQSDFQLHIVFFHWWKYFIQIEYFNWQALWQQVFFDVNSWLKWLVFIWWFLMFLFLEIFERILATLVFSSPFKSMNVFLLFFLASFRSFNYNFKNIQIFKGYFDFFWCNVFFYFLMECFVYFCVIF